MNEGMRRYLASLPAGSVKRFTTENCAALAEYERAMSEDTIPAIERALKAQQRAAHFCLLGIPDPAIAAGSRRAKTPQAVECEASQSGPKGIAQTKSVNP
jgi:hypothetical protein